MKKTTIMVLAFTAAVFAGQVGAQGDASAGKAKSESCAGCHGEDGNANAPIFPKLAGQHASYLVKQLHEFKSQKRLEPTMNAMAASLSDADIADMSAWFAQHRVKPEQAEKNALGERIYRSGIAAKAVPACSACHGPTGAGNPSSVYPALGGQYPAYIGKTLHDYKAGERNNDPNEIMRTIANRLNEEEINALADYISGLH
ncbi:MAG: c-type cytochrome [Methylococcaceae bacterium]|nr:c-type cytochrome [Methylococcaceae bacterium]